MAQIQQELELLEGQIDRLKTLQKEVLEQNLVSDLQSSSVVRQNKFTTILVEEVQQQNRGEVIELMKEQQYCAKQFDKKQNNQPLFSQSGDSKDQPQNFKGQQNSVKNTKNIEMFGTNLIYHTKRMNQKVNKVQLDEQNKGVTINEQKQYQQENKDVIQIFETQNRYQVGQIIEIDFQKVNLNPKNQLLLNQAQNQILNIQQVELNKDKSQEKTNNQIYWQKLQQDGQQNGQETNKRNIIGEEQNKKLQKMNNAFKCQQLVQLDQKTNDIGHQYFNGQTKKDWVLLIKNENATRQQLIQNNKVLMLKIIKLESIILKYKKQLAQRQIQQKIVNKKLSQKTNKVIQKVYKCKQKEVNIFQTQDFYQQRIQSQYQKRQANAQQRYSQDNRMPINKAIAKARTDRAKRSSIQRKVSLNFEFSTVNQLVDQRKKYQSEHNPYIKQCQNLKIKVKQMKQQNQQLKKKLQQQRKNSQLLRKNENQMYQQDLKNSRITSKRSYAGKIIKIDKKDYFSELRKSSKSRQDSSFRVKKVNNSTINLSYQDKQNLKNPQQQPQSKNQLSGIQASPIVDNFTQSIENSKAIQDNNHTNQFQLIIPSIPQPPKYSDTQADLIQIAQAAFQLFGIKISQKASLSIKKFKNCVLFILDSKNTIVWHFDARFYVGGWEINDQGGCKQGFGIQIVPNKFIYKGQFTNNKRHGKGTIKMSNGTVYVGDWKVGIKQGNGRQKDDSGIYNGQWKQNKRHGQGKVVLFDKKVSTNHKYSFQGKFVKGLKNGYGIQFFENGDQYRGQYFNGKFDGKGLYIWANDAHYDGEFKEGMRHGKGLWKSTKSEDFYEGQYLYNKKNGFGIYKWSDGSQYKGYFQDDMQNGEGMFKSAKGQVKQCIWSNGKAIKQIKQAKIKFNTNKTKIKQQTKQKNKSANKGDIKSKSSQRVKRVSKVSKQGNSIEKHNNLLLKKQV